MFAQASSEEQGLRTGWSRYAKYAWGVLAYNIGVILWGAYVRATGSGAGCGNHWPLCDGQIVPQSPRVQTLIEYSHRVTSGLTLLLIIALVVWSFRAFPRGHRVRSGAVGAGVFTLTEALVGAGLVLFQLVAENTSLARALLVAVHLANTFLLLAALTLTAHWASGGQALQLRGQRSTLLGLGLAFLGVLIIGMTGAITALGDTLFRSPSLAQGLQQDASPTAQFLIRLRVFHPLVAILVGLYLIWVVRSHSQNTSLPASRISTVLVALVLIQWFTGLVNVVLLAPLWMQMLHLFLADLIWITLVLFAGAVLVAPAARVFCVSST
jgi:heme A synthase